MRAVKMKTSIVTAVAAAVVSSGLAGCQTTNQLAVYNDPNDVCVSYRQPLIQTEADLQRPIIEGAVAGAVIGGLIGGLATGKVGGAVAGLAAGALTGGALGYYNSRSQQARNQSELLAAINGDAQTDLNRVNSLRGSVKGLQDCRRDQIAQFKRQVAKKELTPDQIRERKAKISVALRDDGDLIQKVLGQVNGRVDTYVQASQQALESTGTTSRKAQQPRAVKEISNAAAATGKQVNTAQNDLFKNLEAVAG